MPCSCGRHSASRRRSPSARTNATGGGRFDHQTRGATTAGPRASPRASGIQRSSTRSRARPTSGRGGSRSRHDARGRVRLPDNTPTAVAGIFAVAELVHRCLTPPAQPSTRAAMSRHTRQSKVRAAIRARHAAVASRRSEEMGHRCMCHEGGNSSALTDSVRGQRVRRSRRGDSPPRCPRLRPRPEALARRRQEVVASLM